jgi:sulfate/thiosulfate transport system ATP-binding protein
VEQIGSPNELYDHPANDFVMGFLGPVTRLAGTLVRPHDIEVLTEDRSGAVAATVTRLVRLGFEVRVELDTTTDPAWVQLTRGQAEVLGLALGNQVWLRPVEHAAVLPVG